MLFAMAARNLQEQRQERRNSIEERCQKALDIVLAHDGPTVSWCELNDESERLAKMIPEAVEVAGSMPEEMKEERLTAFTSGEIKRLITKPKIGCWGLNWQHCNCITSFPSHSYEAYYQKVRRCWRFGQTKPVDVHVIVNEGEVAVLKNIRRKAAQADAMFTALVKHMNDSLALSREERFPEQTEVPSWL